MGWNQISDFIDLDPALIRIQIHIDQILWIRISIRSMRIHITGKEDIYQ